MCFDHDDWPWLWRILCYVIIFLFALYRQLVYFIFFVYFVDASCCTFLCVSVVWNFFKHFFMFIIFNCILCRDSAKSLLTWNTWNWRQTYRILCVLFLSTIVIVSFILVRNRAVFDLKFTILVLRKFWLDLKDPTGTSHSLLASVR